MTDFLAQSQILNQGGTDGWVDLLVLVAMGVFWALAGLLRAGAGKKGQSARTRVQAGVQRRPQQNWQQRLIHKAEEMQRAAEVRKREADERMEQMQERAGLRVQRREPQPVPGQPRSGNIAVHSTPGGDSVLVYEPARPSARLAREEHAARQREAREAVSAAGRAGKMSAPVLTEIEAGRSGSEPLIESMTSVASESTKPLDPRREELGVSQDPAGYGPDSIINYADRDALKKAILHYEILGKPLALRDSSETGF